MKVVERNSRGQGERKWGMGKIEKGRNYDKSVRVRGSE